MKIIYSIKDFEPSVPSHSTAYSINEFPHPTLEETIPTSWSPHLMAYINPHFADNWTSIVCRTVNKHNHCSNRNHWWPKEINKLLQAGHDQYCCNSLSVYVCVYSHMHTIEDPQETHPFNVHDVEINILGGGNVNKTSSPNCSFNYHHIIQVFVNTFNWCICSHNCEQMVKTCIYFQNQTNG